MEHQYVTVVDFSPCDKYVVTCNAASRGGLTQQQQAKRDAQTVKRYTHTIHVYTQIILAQNKNDFVCLCFVIEINNMGHLNR